MMKAILIAALLLQANSSPFTGSGIVGGGTACNGSLRVYANYIDYEVGSSTCDHVPYKKLRTASNGPWAYQFTARKKGCLLEVLQVERDSDGLGWDVKGFVSIEAWQKDDITRGIECGMY